MQQRVALEPGGGEAASEHPEAAGGQADRQQQHCVEGVAVDGGREESEARQPEDERRQERGAGPVEVVSGKKERFLDARRVKPDAHLDDARGACHQHHEPRGKHHERASPVEETAF